jgi:hypothetical protein
MVDIQTVSIVVASVGVFAASVYYILQIRHQTKLRQTDLIMRLYSAYGTREFLEGMWKVLNLETVNYEDYAKTQDLTAASEVGVFFEGLGILLKRKIVDISLVDDLYSSTIIMSWEKTKPIWEILRKQYGRPQIFEYFEYLYNEMKKREQQQASKTA